jgi:SAM-dependent methyltransferase
MRRFWDRRAAEDPFYFVDNRQPYGAADQARFWREGEEDLDRLLAALGVHLAPADEVVEIGCGIGRLTRAMAPRVRSVRALDVSPRMLELARRYVGAQHANVTWLLGDGQSLSGVEAASASAVVSHVVFQHIPDPAVTLGYIREIGRVLRPGGWAAFQVSDDPAVHAAPGWPRRLGGALPRVLRRGPGGQADPAWLGAAVSLAEVREAAQAGRAPVRRVVGEGTQMCCVLLVRD